MSLDTNDRIFIGGIEFRTYIPSQTSNKLLLGQKTLHVVRLIPLERFNSQHLLAEMMTFCRSVFISYKWLGNASSLGHPRRSEFQSQRKRRNASRLLLASREKPTVSDRENTDCSVPHVQRNGRVGLLPFERECRVRLDGRGIIESEPLHE